MGSMGEERLDHNQAAPHSKPPQCPTHSFGPQAGEVSLQSSGPQLCPKKAPQALFQPLLSPLCLLAPSHTQLHHITSLALN